MNFLVSGNASLLEILWTVMGVIGLVFSFLNLDEAVDDWKVIRRFVPPDARHLLARQAIRTELVRVAELTGFVAIGLIAMSFPSRSGSAAFITASVFIGLIALISANSFLDFRVRRNVNFLSATTSGSPPETALEDSW